MNSSALFQKKFFNQNYLKNLNVELFNLLNFPKNVANPYKNTLTFSVIQPPLGDS